MEIVRINLKFHYVDRKHEGLSYHILTVPPQYLLVAAYFPACACHLTFTVPMSPCTRGSSMRCVGCQKVVATMPASLWRLWVCCSDTHAWGRKTPSSFRTHSQYRAKVITTTVMHPRIFHVCCNAFVKDNSSIQLRYAGPGGPHSATMDPETVPYMLSLADALEVLAQRRIVIWSWFTFSNECHSFDLFPCPAAILAL